ncbi:MAG: UDP-glucose 4-epimerase GalE [Vicinamibacteria bacterium]|nr:UDP-glucose 4-epimerase GalE [Vicinamibacteria bacterium]
MAVLITGGAGYIGSVTVEVLRQRGEQVVVLDDLARGHRAALDSSLPFYPGRVGDRELIARIVREQAVTDCVHFAALAYVGESVEDPAKYYENNVGEGVALLGALVQAGVKRFVFSSTCATYGEPREVPIPETHPQWPANPYGWSKLFIERILASYDDAYGMKFVALRYFNAAGATAERGEDHRPESHLIPLVLEVALGVRPCVQVFGTDYPTPDGTAVRDYIHVVDLAEAHVLALDHLRRGGASETFNLGTGTGYSVREVIACAERVTGQAVATKMVGRRAGDPARLVAQADKARVRLGWQTRMNDLDAIVSSAWAWKQKHPRGYEE